MESSLKGSNPAIMNQQGGKFSSKTQGVSIGEIKQSTSGSAFSSK